MPIRLDKPRTMRFDLNAMVAFERAMGGKSIRTLSLVDPTDEERRALIWASLIHEDENLTINDVGRMISFGSLPDVYAAATEAVFAGIPDRKPEEETNPQT
jgi:hypothetical protein